ncbi:MAG: hypothetical protein ACI936_000032 [Paraglaciecola sp.]|jgi:hypothetical protein
MLSDTLKSTIQNAYNELEAAGFKKRKPQMLLMGKLATAAAHGIPFIGEAPTTDREVSSVCAGAYTNCTVFKRTSCTQYRDNIPSKSIDGRSRQS